MQHVAVNATVGLGGRGILWVAVGERGWTFLFLGPASHVVCRERLCAPWPPFFSTARWPPPKNRALVTDNWPV